MQQLSTDSEGKMMCRGSMEWNPPYMRIVLLGKNEAENCRVGNTILGRAAFYPETPPGNIQQHSERVRGKLEERHITVINAAALLNPDLSPHSFTQGVRHLLYLSAPGPHVIILVLQHNDFSKQDKNRVKNVLKQFNEETIKHTIVLTTDEETYSCTHSIVMKNSPLHQLIKECGGGHLQVALADQGLHSEIIQRIESLIHENGDFLICELHEAYKRTSLDEEPSSSEGSVNREKEKLEDVDQCKGRHMKTPYFFQREKPKLNLVLCGREGSLKASVSKLLRGRKSKPPSSHQKESEVCVKKEGEAYGRHITVVELPALSSSDLSEEEVIRETFSCVSLCDPGVHAFLFIYPDGPCTDEHKEEIEMIQRIFHPRDHIILLLTTDTVGRPVTDFVEFPSLCGDRWSVLSLKEHGVSKQISELLNFIESMMTEPYSLHMYMRAQRQTVRCELEAKHEEQLKKMEKTIKELQLKIPLKSVEDESDSLRILLIGKTGNGQSARGNTILGRKEFLSQLNARSVTNVCQKGFGEVDGKSVAVIDTPGLFDTTLTNEQVQEEINKCISLSAPGPHAFIIVLTVGTFTNEEMKTVDLIKTFFGPEAAQFSIVLFTRGDDLEGETIEDFVKRSDSAELNKLLRDCGNRFLAFNNKVKNPSQVTQLLNMIEMIMKSNTDQYFTNSMFEDAEMSIKKRVEEILKEKERKFQAQKEKLKYDREQLEKRLEEEKRKMDEERVQVENMFKEKEEKLRKEFEEKEETEKRKREIEDQIRSEKKEQLKNEYHNKIENQRSQYEKLQKEREKEDKKREEKYKQDQEKLKIEKEYILRELKKKQEEKNEKEAIRWESEEKEESEK